MFGRRYYTPIYNSDFFCLSSSVPFQNTDCFCFILKGTPPAFITTPCMPLLADVVELHSASCGVARFFYDPFKTRFLPVLQKFIKSQPQGVWAFCHHCHMLCCICWVIMISWHPCWESIIAIFLGPGSWMGIIIEDICKFRDSCTVFMLRMYMWVDDGGQGSVFCFPFRTKTYLISPKHMSVMLKKLWCSVCGCVILKMNTVGFVVTSSLPCCLPRRSRFLFWFAQGWPEGGSDQALAAPSTPVWRKSHCLDVSNEKSQKEIRAEAGVNNLRIFFAIQSPKLSLPIPETMRGSTPFKPRFELVASLVGRGVSAVKESSSMSDRRTKNMLGKPPVSIYHFLFRRFKNLLHRGFVSTQLLMSRKYLNTAFPSNKFWITIFLDCVCNLGFVKKYGGFSFTL